MRNVLAGSARVAISGIATGVVGVVRVNQWIGSFLFGIQALDATTLTAAAAVLVKTAIVATLTPVWRAVSVDPVTLFRQQCSVATKWERWDAQGDGEELLRDLEREGYVSRTVYPVSPPKVEYALTKLGRSVLGPRGDSGYVLVTW